MMSNSKIIKINCDDIENIRNIKNSVIVSTHPSFLDIVVLMSIIPYSTCFVSEKLSRNPFLKGIVKYLFILEGQDLEKWLNDACNKLENGMNIIIFPMGTRHKKDEHKKIRRGASLIAQKSQKDIVILDMKTSFGFLQINQPFYDAGEETVEYYLKYVDKINTKEYLNKYPDEVTFKTEITKLLSKILYNLN